MKNGNYYEILKAVMESLEAKLSQKEIAKVLNISQPSFSDYESGKRPMPVKHLITLCKYYDISADYILGFTEKLPFPKK